MNFSPCTSLCWTGAGTFGAVRRHTAVGARVGATVKMGQAAQLVTVHPQQHSAAGAYVEATFVGFQHDLAHGFGSARVP